MSSPGSAVSRFSHPRAQDVVDLEGSSPAVQQSFAVPPAGAAPASANAGRQPDVIQQPADVLRSGPAQTHNPVHTHSQNMPQASEATWEAMLRYARRVQIEAGRALQPHEISMLSDMLKQSISTQAAHNRDHMMDVVITQMADRQATDRALLAWFEQQLTRTTLRAQREYAEQAVEHHHEVQDLLRTIEVQARLHRNEIQAVREIYEAQTRQLIEHYNHELEIAEHLLSQSNLKSVLTPSAGEEAEHDEDENEGQEQAGEDSANSFNVPESSVTNGQEQ